VSKAKDNATYFAGGNRNASAHLFVDANETWQSVEFKNIAWAVGSNGLLDQGSPFAKFGGKLFRIATNTNSISVEMCLSSAGTIAEATQKETGEIFRWLMDEFKVPIDNVIRHFDVNGKVCPIPLLDNNVWNAWKQKYILEASVPDALPQIPTPTTPGNIFPAPPAEEFRVKVTGSALNYRSGPGTEFKVNGTITDKGVYTIVEIRTASDGGEWGKLKSGAGWIYLAYTSKL
jgi:hypothetical protein